MSSVISRNFTSFSGMMSKHLLWVLALAAAFSANAAHANSEDVLKRIQRDGQARVIVRMKADAAGVPWSAMSAGRQRKAVAAALESAEPTLRNARIRPTKTFRTLPFMGATVNKEQLLELMAAPDVESVTLVRRERRMQNTARLIERPAITAATDSIDASGAWARGYDGAGYAVAVIDDGFNFNHPMLQGKNVGDACFAADYETTKNNCPSGVTPQIGPGAASNCTAGRCSHGTHIASLAAGNDGTNFGVARAANIVPIDVFSTETDATACAPELPPCELTDSYVVLEALDYINENAAALNIAAVNLSLGGTAREGYCDEDLRKSVIDMLRQKGIAVVAAAGNDGLTGKSVAPGCVSSSVSVGATNDSTTVSSLSNFASTVDLMAPGVAVLGASSTGSGLVAKSGTSIAVPHVAGAWVVMRSAFPNATADQIESVLKETGLEVTRTDSDITVPKIQLTKAINRLQGKDRQMLSNMVTSSAQYLGYSYLRFANTSSDDGKITITLRDVGTGEALGVWTSPVIPANAAPQFDLRLVEAEASTTRPIVDGTRTYYNFDIASTFSGHMQHVLWAGGAGVLSNLTSCPTGFASDAANVSNVYASTSGGYLSRVRVVNTSAAPEKATLTYHDAFTGEEIGQWVSGNIAAGAAVELTPDYLEAQLPALKAAVDAGLAQYNIRLSDMSGYAQHVVLNGSVGVLMDMSPKCDLRVTTSSETTAAAQ
jgi:subtilisin